MCVSRKRTMLVVGGFEPTNSRLLVDCSANCDTFLETVHFKRFQKLSSDFLIEIFLQESCLGAKLNTLPLFHDELIWFVCGGVAVINLVEFPKRSLQTDRRKLGHAKR
jgi:hypothetical protein